MLHPPYIPITFVLLAALSFTLVLSYAESWGRGQSRTVHSPPAPGAADRSGVTGETHHVDCGYNIVGMKAVDAPDISVV